MATYKGTKIPTCYASCSIGHKKEHNLPAKLKAISQAGFDAIELSMPDIISHSAEIDKDDKEAAEDDYETLAKVGADVKKYTDQYGLKILILQPFSNFEGWERGSRERADAFERAKGWMRIMEAVGTDMLQIGSTDAPNVVSDIDQMAEDLASLADIMAPKNFRIAYENWCWATVAPDWRDVWQIVEKANRPNLGLCLDTFQSAGGEWADPTTKSGLREDKPRAEVEAAWKASCAALSKTIPPEKIFFLQISDAYKMDPPIENKPDKDGLRPRGQWSHDYRPIPYDGGYLPVADFTMAVLNTGFRGWMSMEVFDGQAPQKYPDNMQPYASGAMDSLQRLLHEATSSA